MAVADRLVEITRKDLEILKKLYALNANAQNYVSYTTIENYIRWFERESYLKHVKVYCLNGNISDGTFVIIVSFLFLNSFFFLFSGKFCSKISIFACRIDAMCMLTHFRSRAKISRDCSNCWIIVKGIIFMAFALNFVKPSVMHCTEPMLTSSLAHRRCSTVCRKMKP